MGEAPWLELLDVFSRGLEEGARGGQSCSFGPIQITHLEYSSVTKRNKIYTHYDIDEPQKLYGNCKKPDTQGYVLNDPINIKCAEKAKPWRQKGD